MTTQVLCVPMFSHPSAQTGIARHILIPVSWSGEGLQRTEKSPAGDQSPDIHGMQVLQRFFEKLPRQYHELV